MRELRQGESHVLISGIKRSDGKIEIVQTQIPQTEAGSVGYFNLGGLEVRTLTNRQLPTSIVVNPKQVFLEVSEASPEQSARRAATNNPTS